MPDEVECWLATHPVLEDGASLPNGTVIGRWRVLGLLGRGGSSELYRVDELSTGESAALKIAWRRDDVVARRFERERSILTAGLGLYFPRFIESGVFDGRPFLVMELLQADDELPHRDAEVADYLRAICHALSSLHRYGFIHRDVKPANILFRIGADGRKCPVLVDFGLAKFREADGTPPKTSDLTREGGHVVGVGTPGFAAPEQFSGGDVSPAMDIHALGVVIERCFDHRVPLAWRAIVCRATSSLPQQRFRNVDELLHAVERRHLKWRCVVVGGLVALGLVMFWMFGQPSEVERYAAESMKGTATTLPGLPPDLAVKYPEKDAILKIEGMLEKARRQHAFFVEKGITNLIITLPDFANCRERYVLTDELRMKYGPAVTNLYNTIKRDHEAGKCGYPVYSNVCRVLF